MLVANREIYKVNRIIKREYTTYKESKKEIKEYKSKRSKPMKYDI